jgi:ATP-binding cassette subfamily B protein
MFDSTIKKQTVFGIYLRKVMEHPWLFTGVLAGTLLSQAADLASPLYLKNFFNTLVAHGASATNEHALFIIIGIILAISLVDWLSIRLFAFSIMYLESGVMSSLNADAFSYLIGHSYHFFSSQFTGTLTRRVRKFSDAFETLFDSIMLQFLPTALFVMGAVTILFIRNHTLGLLLGIWAVLFVTFQVYVAKLRQPVRIARAEEDSRMTGTLADALSNQTTISLFSGRKFENKRFSEAILKWRKATMLSWNTDELIWGALGLLIVGINIGMLYGAVIYWERGLLTIGDFVLIQAYLLTTFQQLIGINRNLRRFYDSYADASEMVQILNTPYDVKDLPASTQLSVGDRAINFTDVDFFFNETRPVLSDFNLHISGSEKVAFVGPSGAGKSTITKLLLRFYDVSKGHVTIDGQDIAHVTQDSLREAVAFVPQEPILFHRSLMENIRYGRRDATDEEVIEASKKAHCHEFISGFPEQYETFVGERGVKLSGGERQRVAIARAILKNAPILVLDEATSSLDSESERFIQEALDILMEGKTVIVIAHRLSTIMKMDRIIVVDGGQIAAQGTHEELLQQGGLYQKLWNIQAGGFIADEDEADKKSNLAEDSED